MTPRFQTLRRIVLVSSAALLAACGDRHDNTTTANDPGCFGVKRAG
jgi:hypothetical protein